MKKLITLLLVLTGCVMTASAKKIYFANNFSNINTLKLYRFGGSASDDTWPGVDFPVAESFTIDGYPVYHLDLGDYTGFIITFKFNDDNTQRQSQDTSSSSYSEGSYLDFSSSWDGNNPAKVALSSALTVYTHNLNAKTADTWSNFYIWAWSDSGNFFDSWPGQSVSGVSNEYSYSLKSFHSSISLIFNQGDGQPQTCNLSAVSGTNNYYICGMNKVDDVWGEAVKTNASGYATYVSTKALTIPASTAYVATDNNNGSATATAVTNPAGSTAMLIKGNASTTYHFGTAESGTSYASNAFHAGPVTGLASNPSTGIYNYILNGDTFKAANGKNVGENKAYLQLSKSAPAGARVLKFDGDDETTGINTVENGQPVTENTAVYNLNGQRIMKPTKGLYIQNGKKYIVK